MGGSVKKTYLLLADKPVLVHTVAAFESSMLVDSIVVVVAAEDLEECRKLLSEYGFLKIMDVIPGGSTRQQSVFSGLQRVEQADIVIIHDGVRPFVTHGMIETCVDMACQHGAAITAVPVKDTIKMANDTGFVRKTLERTHLWAVQTPQAFRRSVLLEAHRRAIQEGVNATDDAALVEQLGYPVKLVPGDDRNLKITTPGDLAVAAVQFQQNTTHRA